MLRMAARYGHFALEELRSAVESISRPEIKQGFPVIPPLSQHVSGSGRANQQKEMAPQVGLVQRPHSVSLVLSVTC